MNLAMARLEKLEYDLAGHDHEIAQYVSAKLSESREKTGTIKSWFEKNKGKKVHTVQSAYHRDFNAWFPINRVINEVTSSKAIIDNSIKDFAGNRVISQNDSVLIGYNNWNVFIYIVAED